MKNNKFKRSINKGFTLVELVVVIAVIAILAGVSVGAYFGITKSANDSKLLQEAKTASTVLRLANGYGANYSNKGLTIEELDTLKEICDYIKADLNVTKDEVHYNNGMILSQEDRLNKLTDHARMHWGYHSY